MLSQFSFSKASRLLRSRDFRLCAKHGVQRTGCLMHISLRETSQPGIKLGLTVSRRYGKATHRNRFKRLVREAFRLSQHELPDQIHFNVRPRSASLTASLAEIREELTTLLKND